MNTTETERLAASINALRPDWPVASLSTFIAGQLANRAYRDAALALAWVATDPDTRTPARVLEAGPWWNTTRTATTDPDPYGVPSADRCPYHPDQTKGACPRCAQHARTIATPGQAAGYLAQMRQTIRDNQPDQRPQDQPCPETATDPSADQPTTQPDPKKSSNSKSTANSGEPNV